MLVLSPNPTNRSNFSIVPKTDRASQQFTVIIAPARGALPLPVSQNTPVRILPVMQLGYPIPGNIRRFLNGVISVSQYPKYRQKFPQNENFDGFSTETFYIIRR